MRVGFAIRRSRVQIPPGPPKGFILIHLNLKLFLRIGFNFWLFRGLSLFFKGILSEIGLNMGELNLWEKKRV